ncbi:permease [Leptothermofonsia sichuanensis E412]|uniref:permease n=1 Tax=Leptothermofonsia sichuanensis TaxID=2917832 RepID=UPI001CA6B834|nr:permease [Leptothermofonsia sichuanensis]QZZ20939.1 permease [Leptothermofonsia sichuanensis E412]
MNSNQLNNAFTLFLSLLVEAVPFLLLGVLFSGVLLFFVDERKLVRMMPKNPLLGAFAGSCIGFLFPVCECGNVPVARRLLMQGVPSSVAIGFLLAAPTINPIVFWATWTAFRDQPEVVFLRIGFSLAIATIVGWVFSVQKDLRPMLQPAVARAIPVRREDNEGKPKLATSSAFASQSSPLLQSGTYWLNQPGQTGRTDVAELQATMVAASTAGKPLSYKFNLLLENTVQEFRELGGVLILGSAIAAIVQVFVPRDIILSLGQGPVTSILAMMLLAAVVSICSTVDSFFALSFASTFTTGSLLAFLVFGPMIDLKAVGLMLSIFKPRAIFYLFALAGQLTFLLTLIVNLYVS